MRTVWSSVPTSGQATPALRQVPIPLPLPSPPHVEVGRESSAVFFLRPVKLCYPL